jgi:hypothetical protein
MIRALSKIFSYLFHPLFILTYMLVILLTVNPYAFGMRSVMDGDQLIPVSNTHLTLPTTPYV